VARIWEPCAGGIVLDDSGRLLLIRRATPPSAGQWSIPGGRCQAGESGAAACVREVAEETGLVVHVVRRAGRVRRAGPDGVGYDIEDFVCSVVGGELRAGDDAAEARWVSHTELASLDLVPGLVEALESWDALPS
jgi:8-oxo-dGTP diphosphatase